MRIIIIVRDMSMGGSQKVAINLAEWIMTQTSSSVQILALQNTNQQIYDLQKIDFYVLNKEKKIRQLRAHLKKEAPDIVLTLGVPLSVITVPACLGIKTKHIISERNNPATFTGKKITKIISRILMHKAEGYVFQTTDARDFYGGRIAKQSKVIPNPLFNTENMPAQPFDGPRKKTIVSVGRLNTQKNQKMLIEAFAEIADRYPEYRLVIWGEGPEETGLKALIEKLQVSQRVILPGPSRKVLQEIYQDSVFVLPSDFEGMPNALMEALALGLPCISTDCPCGGPRALIRNMENGILVPVNDKEALKDKLCYLLEHPQEAQTMGAKAFTIREEYHVNRICRMWFDYFEEVMQNGK
ncbi:MAG: glycosyltransferase [Clostridia bacterium]|nr:glycosyltransferase [Clostridia bacterium]